MAARKATTADTVNWLLTFTIGTCTDGEASHNLSIDGKRLECSSCRGVWYAPVKADPRWGE